MTRPLIFLFPGQSSRDADMFARLRAAAPEAADSAQALLDEHLGRALDPQFATNLDVQLGVVCASLGWLRALRERGLDCVASAGMSLGEYTHLVDIGALAPGDAVALVAARGAAYDAGPTGAMAAVQPITVDEASGLLAELHAEHGWPPGTLAISNYNSPTQLVVAGEPAALDLFIDAADEAFYAVGTVIEKRIPMHTPRFEPVAEALRPHLDAAPWIPPSKSYWPNVAAAPLDDAAGAAIAALLRRHVFEAVRWRQTIDAMNQRHPDALFVEVGPRRVLRNLLTRRWIPRERVFSVDPEDAADPAAIDALCGALGQRDG